jgi:hypothetical protein
MTKISKQQLQQLQQLQTGFLPKTYDSISNSVSLMDGTMID